MSQMPDLADLYQQLESMKHDSIVEPASQWYDV
jgi:hypothetical protein